MQSALVLLLLSSSCGTLAEFALVLLLFYSRKSKGNCMKVKVGIHGGYKSKSSLSLASVGAQSRREEAKSKSRRTQEQLKEDKSS